MDINISQSDLFANKEVKAKTLNVKAELTEDKELIETAKEATTQEIPEEYIAINLHTLGKLQAPAVLHFKNYTLEDAADLANFSEENQYEIFIKILNRSVYEDFDCHDLHKEEVLEILLTIYATFWSPILERSYYINEDLEGEDLVDKANIGHARLRITSDIVIKDIDQVFKAPFALKSPTGKTFKLRLSTVGDLVFAKKLVEMKFKEEEKKFGLVKRLLLQGKELEVEPEKLADYKEYLSIKLKEGLLIERSQMLLSIDDEELEDIDKLEIARTLPLSFWAFVTQTQKMYDFGLTKEITFFNDKKEQVTRSFQFRFIDLFPPMESESSGGYSISFD